MRIDVRDGPGGGVTLRLVGRIDANNSARFRETIQVVPPQARLTLDFSDVSYVSSAGLRELLVCRKRFEGERLRIVNVSPEVMEILGMVGFDELLPIEAAAADVAAFVRLSFKALLERRVKDSGDRAAMVCGDTAWTWRDVDRASRGIAAGLSALGVKPRSRVGLCAVHPVNWVLTFCAIQSLGAMAMLINSEHSTAEIGRVCALGDVEVLCHDNGADAAGFMAAVRSAEGCRVRAFYAVDDAESLKDRPGEDPAIGAIAGDVDADAPCTVIFTSGSTGRPKGVILSAYNLLNAAAVQVRLQRVTAADRCLLTVPLFHILGLVVCLLPCAMTGATLVVPRDRHIATLIDVMARERCTLMHSVPTLVMAIVSNPAFDPGRFSSLRCTVLAGAAATRNQLRLFRERLPGDHFMIAYGLSEMAPVSQTLYDDTEEHLLNTVGRPVGNIRVRVVDRKTGADCPPGTPGEILVQGVNLMTGYYRLPLEDQAIDGEGWLHTGDMGSLDAEGYLSLKGRYKELIIRGGENIMPAEVEAAVAALPGVDDVKVVGVPSDFYGEEVAACVKPAEGAAWDEDAARIALGRALAKYKIPRWFILLEAFPLLGSGKIDVAALRAQAVARIQGAGGAAS